MSSISSKEQRRTAAREHMESLFKHAAELSASMPQTNIVPIANLAENQLSEARLETNRINATERTGRLVPVVRDQDDSIGPKTDLGKSVSRENSFKHGIYSKQLVIKGEDPAALDALKSDLVLEHQPATLTEQLLVNEMADHYWRLLRFRRFEAGLMQSDEVSIPQITAVQRFMSSAERGFHKAFKTLREVQKERRAAQPQQPALKAFAANGGFVPHKSPDGGFVPSKPGQSAAAHEESQPVSDAADPGGALPKAA